ncbi:unnamed protein product [Cuscuta europaea]|uniref:Uncharacterized protein n=1 Tax=Cuscuta europaea TaxID=41803 RepID=A0A9P0YJY2_CUSEU|nr:unnamed protein product [Cuscuta europaea]
MKLVVQKYITMGRNKKKKLKSKANQSLPGILGADEKAKEGRLEEKTERNREKGRTRKKKKDKIRIKEQASMKLDNEKDLASIKVILKEGDIIYFNKVAYSHRN